LLLWSGDNCYPVAYRIGDIHFYLIQSIIPPLTKSIENLVAYLPKLQETVGEWAQRSDVLTRVLDYLTVFAIVPVGLWISAFAANVRVSIFTLIGMRLRRVVPSRVINPLIKATKAGINVSINKLEAHYLAGGNVDRVVNALIAAQRANIPLEFERAAAIDLAGRNVLEAVQMSVNPKLLKHQSWQQ